MSCVYYLFVLPNIFVFIEIRYDLPKVKSIFLEKINPTWKNFVPKKRCFRRILTSQRKEK